MFTPNEDKLMTPGPVWHGAGLGWHDSISSYITPIQSSHDRFCCIRFKSDFFSSLMISLYAPTHGKDDEFIECIDHLSQFLLINLSENEVIIIGADTNCSTKSSARRRQAWRTFCDAFSLEQKSSQYPTFHHHNGTSDSCVDMFLAPKSLNLATHGTICTLESPLNLSSHDVLTCSLPILSEPKRKSLYEHTYSEFKREKVIWNVDKIPAYQALAGQALSKAVGSWSAQEYIPLLCTMFSKLLVTSAKLVFDTKLTNTVPVGRKNKSKKLEKAEKLVVKRFKYWKRAGRPMDKNNPYRSKFCQAKSNLQKLNRYEQSLENIRLNNKLMYSNLHNKNQVYSTLKNLRSERMKPPTQSLETPVGTYYGKDVLEGFAADAEFLGRPTADERVFDKEFYEICKLDNIYIFSFRGDEPIQIPPMTQADLDNIVNRMKSGKACDLYQLSPEHLKHCGVEARQALLILLNKIINNIYYLTCQQLKVGLATTIHKGKNKPATKSSSYRRITVTPIIGSILDKYVDPIAEKVFRPSQSPDQLGFTSKLNYLMASVQRGECQRWALDKKQTCFGISLDGESAFPSVEREIQIRELYSVGERGNLLEYSKNTYVNTDCYLRKISEYKGNRQGHVRSSGHYKVYINPLLTALNKSKLGFHIGPICVTAVAVADDTYLFAGSPSALQAILKIVSFFARRYRIKFNTSKTKLVVTGSQLDMDYYADISPWTLNGESICVTENNEHLGIVVSGKNEELKNVDRRIQECRKSLYSLLGPAYAFKCLLPPSVKIHLWRTYCLPILWSGLSALPIRPNQMKSAKTFQNKILRSFLHLSKVSPIPALYFLLGELPIEARIHIGVLTLFHSIWSNPETTIFRIVQYILMMSDSKSCTWSAHVRNLCLIYDLPDPLELLSCPAWPKSKWLEIVKTKVTIFHEKALRGQAITNSKMQYLNVKLQGLSGLPHIALQNIRTT